MPSFPTGNYGTRFNMSETVGPPEREGDVQINVCHLAQVLCRRGIVEASDNFLSCLQIKEGEGVAQFNNGLLIISCLCHPLSLPKKESLTSTITMRRSSIVVYSVVLVMLFFFFQDAGLSSSTASQSSSLRINLNRKVARRVLRIFSTQQYKTGSTQVSIAKRFICATSI